MSESTDIHFWTNLMVNFSFYWENCIPLFTLPFPSKSGEKKQLSFPQICNIKVYETWFISKFIEKSLRSSKALL